MGGGGPWEADSEKELNIQRVGWGCSQEQHLHGEGL